MKLGFSTVMYEKTSLNLPEIVAKAASLGYQGIELNYKVWPSELDLDQIRESLMRFGVEAAAIGTRHMHVTHGLYLASPREEVRIKALAYVQECMKIARRLNCSTVQAGWAFQGSKLEASYRVVWRHAVKSLKTVGKLALEHGVCFVIEFACRQNAELVNRMDEALRMLDQVGCENVLVMADVFHIYAEGDPLRQTILKSSGRLGYVHLSDSDRLTPGRGHINFKELIEALKEAGYKGYLVMEFDPDSTPDEALSEAIDYLKKIL